VWRHSSSRWSSSSRRDAAAAVKGRESVGVGTAACDAACAMVPEHS
jgi:hypothetical protein